MTLQFNSYPLEPWIRQQEQNQRPDINQTVTQPILQGLQQLSTDRRQNALAELAASKEAREQQESESKNGIPIDPNLEVGEATPMFGKSSFMPGGQGPVGTGFNLKQRFNEWRAGGMKQNQARGEFIPALSEDERKKFYESANPKEPTSIDEILARKVQAGEMTVEQAYKIKSSGQGEPPPYVIPTFDQNGRVTGYQYLPPGTKPAAGFTRPYVTPGDQETQKLQAKKTANQPLEKRNLNNALSNFDRLISEAEAIKNHPSLGMASGLSGIVAGRIPATGAYNVTARLNTLKSKTGFQVLQEMRANSPTGGALGQISDRENQLLQENIANLDRAQSDEDVKDALQRVINYANEAKQRLQRAFNDYYSDSGENYFSASAGGGNNDPLGVRE